jgi:tetratricopeptide (TPR) repeat protein
MKRNIYLLLLAYTAAYLFSCTKFLDEKQDKKLVVPSTLKDLQAILDYYPWLNQNAPGMGDPSSDDYYLGTNEYKAMRESERRLYTWEPDNVNLPYQNEWGYAYDNVYKCNTILSVLPSIERTEANAAAWDNVKGQALAVRGKTFMELAFTWCLAYDPATAATDLGIPLRLDPDFNKVSVRSTLEETYTQALKDLKEASELLPVTPVHVMRMSRPAAFAFLSRTYWAMRKYDQAGIYADSCLKLNNTLMDYSTLSTTAAYPFARFNPEVVWETINTLHEHLYITNARIDSTLYASYADNDLRKTLFFKALGNGSYSFRGSYDGGEPLFGGVAVDEMYLIRAESYVRAGNRIAGLADLNALLVKRWKKNTFIPFSAATDVAALNLILHERRKELLMRNLRWIDIKRLNKEGTNILLKRLVDGKNYTLPPNDPRYAISIPEQVIALTGMPQNPR